ncbi:hypothetical protein [Streptomyces sp. NPDC007346]|uniref:hypothetical protein n=1 Tax=Streptomyces sp. NPDC007346 TaxID=3154682 RepID=UPI0034570629
MVPGRPAVWPSRCAVCLLLAAGAVLGPWGTPGPPGGTAYGASAADSPPTGATPTATPPGPSSPAATPLPSGTPAGAAPPSALPSADPPSGLPSALVLPLPLPLSPLPSGLPGSGEAEGPVGSPSAEPGDVDGSAEAPSDSASSSPSRSASVEVSGSTAPMAGREAGAGKARPGRSLTPLELTRAETPTEPEPSLGPEDTAADLLVFTPPPEAFSEPGPPPARALDAAAVRQVQQVSLGSGIALVGLGLAFLAFRLRRVN